MHRIRLREPWTAWLTEDATALVYSRKFHKPTGIEGHPLRLKISFLASIDQGFGEVFVVVNGIEAELLNGTPNEPAATEQETNRYLLFQLRNLEPFNHLEIRISGLMPTIVNQAPKLDATVVPTFGSFVIESVELQIE